jgi:hypothetical protein
VNSKKEKVSKVILLACFVCAQALLGPARQPEFMPLLVADPATLRAQADASTNCARTPGELRFEMITAESEIHPPPRRAVVCLAVYRPGD